MKLQKQVMENREHTEMENMALAAELARQLCHDFNNFLYNLFLLFEISKASPASVKPSDWDSVKNHGDKLVRLLRDWDQFHRRFSFEECDIDLNELLRK